MLNRLLPWMRANVLRRRLEREMREEMAEHLDRSTARLVGRGLSEPEARRQAMREFGNVSYLQEEARYARGTTWLDAVHADVRFAVRHFRRRPVTMLVMLVVLAIGMSISTLLFSYVYSYAKQAPPGVAYREDLVRIRGSVDAGPDGRAVRTFTEDEFAAYRELSDQFSAVAGWTFGSVVLDAAGDVERSGLDGRVTFVTGNYFRVLGVRPVLGPGLAASDAEGGADAAVAVIGHVAWEQLFGSDPSVIGRTVAVNGIPVTIVGVAPERFAGIGPFARFQLWMPLPARELVLPGSAPAFRSVAQLRPGVGLAQATAAVQVVAARTVGELDEMRTREPSAEVVPLLSANGDPMFDRDVKLMSFAVGLLALLVLLVTCTNVSALLTGLATARRHEIATRLSLGAARGRVIRQLLTESALLGTVAAAAALGIVWLVVSAVARSLPALPMDLTVRWPAIAFTFGVALAVGVLFGLSPALHATRLAIASAVRDSAGNIASTRARLQRGLVIAQIAFTQPLIVLLSAVLVLVLSNNRPVPRTEDGDRLVILDLAAASPPSMNTEGGTDSRTQLRAATERLLGRLRRTPGIEGAVLQWGGSAQLGRYGTEQARSTEQQAVRLSAERAAPGWFRVRGVPLQRGREFTQDDVGAAGFAGASVAAIVGADLARSLWPGADPLGQRLRPSSDTATAAPTLVVVGVVDDPLADRRVAGAPYRVWLPEDSSRASSALLVRTAAPAAPMLWTLRSIVQEEAPTMVATTRTIAQAEETTRRHFRVVTAALLGAGVMALLISAIGLYAVVAFSVGERTREIAVRLAVGARSRRIVQQFVSDGLRLGVIGLMLGLPVSLLGLRALLTAAGDDFGSVRLPPVMLMAALGVLLVATAAVWIPARRAASVDPAVTLRRE